MALVITLTTAVSSLKGIVISAACAGVVLTFAVKEHGWFKAPHQIGTPIRAVVILLLIWLPLLVLGRSAWRSHVEDEQDEVSARLRASGYVPQGGDVTDSLFTIANDSKYEMLNVGKYCAVSQYRFRGGGSGIGLGIEPMNPSLPTNLRSGGDTALASCVEKLKETEPGIVCIDVTLIIEYEISDDVGSRRNKKFRFQYDGKQWNKWPLDAAPGSACLMWQQ